MRFTVTAAWRRRALRFGAGLGFLFAAWACFAFSPLPDRALTDDYSSALLSSQGSLLRLTLNKAGRYRVKLRLDEVAPELKSGFLRYEDRWFYWHPGVDPVAVLRALAQNLRSGRVVSGASTITMQVARMLERRPRRFSAKLIEAFRALQLEARYSKDEILELYLNNVPMGGNVEGVGAASLLYFGKLPSRLSLAEAALLISLPRSPNARRPDRDPVRARAGRDQVLERILPPGPQLDREKAVPLPQARRANPYAAPHWLQRLSEDLDKDPGIRVSTLDDGLQAMAEGVLREASAGLRSMGVYNGAILIVENQGLKVRAYVGSPDFGDRHEGQINGADILRSPGSALKPLLYGLALDAGLISPHSMLFDIPRDYGGYRPVNFLGNYLGPVPAEEALTRSLNVPAVWLESQLEATEGGGLQPLLKQVGMGGRGREDLQAGLSVVLGAHPVTLEELASLYAGLANGGRWQPLRFFEDRPGDPAERRMLSEGASFIVADMLSKGRRPDLPNAWEFDPKRGRVAFKTGTSFGFRDAWCAAFDPRYTVAVWLGNATGVGSAGLTAAHKAAPVAIGLFNRLDRSQDRWFKPPAGVARRPVCAESGAPPGPFCPSTEDEWYIPGVSPYLPCTVHQQIWVRRKDGRRVAADCMPGPAKDYERRLLSLWPADVTRYLRGSKAKFQALPAPAPDCPSLAELPGPRIISPEPYARYSAAGLAAKQQGLALAAQASADVDHLYWYMDDYLIAEGGPEQLQFWQPTLGEHTVSVLDSRGRSHALTFNVVAESDR